MTLDIACIFQAGTLAAFQSHLQSIAVGSAVSHDARLARPVILCFGGQISTSVSVNRQIYDNFTVMRKNIYNACDAAVTSLGMPSILPQVFDHTPEEDPIRLQTKPFAIQYSCAKT